jgi:hypothetical protein
MSWTLWRRYAEAFRRDVHQLLAWGYADARVGFRAEQDETAITDLIVRGMNARLNAPETDDHFDRYFIADDTPQEGEGREGRSRRRVDILVERNGSKPRLKYILEAKRLRRNGYPLSAYLGGEGIGRFVRGSYAEHALEAAMIGYVQSPSVDEWAKELLAAINGAARVSLAVRSGLDRLAVIAELPHSWVGVHARRGAPNMTICHILLDCIV